MAYINRKNEVLAMSFDFSKALVYYRKQIEETGHKHIAWQLLRSGTSVCANIFEAQTPESKSDFIHKLKIAAKECQETIYWLLLINETIESDKSEVYLKTAHSIARLLSTIIASTRKSL